MTLITPQNKKHQLGNPSRRNRENGLRRNQREIHYKWRRKGYTDISRGLKLEIQGQENFAPGHITNKKGHTYLIRRDINPSVLRSYFTVFQ